MQILHPFLGSIQDYFEALADPDRDRPQSCPQCQARDPLRAHGFYYRTLSEAGLDGRIPVRRFLCCCCQRTVSLLPQFALPYRRFSVSIIMEFLFARLLNGRTLPAAAAATGQPSMPYQRGQFWIRRFQRQAAGLCAALAALAKLPLSEPTSDFVTRALQMLQGIGALAAHRFLFAELRVHLLGWPRFLVPDGRRPYSGPLCRLRDRKHTTFVW